MGKDGKSILTRVDGRVSFPERNGKQPQIGEQWEVEIAGTNPAGTVNFLRLIGKIEPKPVKTAVPTVAPSFAWSTPAEKLPTSGPATIIVVGRPNPSEVRVNGQPVPSVGLLRGEYIEFSLPSRGLMRSAANAYAQHNIRVNSVHPTGVATPMIFNEHMAARFAENPDASAMTGNLLPVPFVEPMDVTNAVVWLASDKARYITGVALPVDAGFAVM